MHGCIERLATVVAQLMALQGKSLLNNFNSELTKLQRADGQASAKDVSRSSEKSKKQDEVDQGTEQKSIPRRGHGPRPQPGAKKMGLG